MSEASRKRAEEIAGPHLIVDDCWYSCSQADCCDDDRRGKPCDCGLDQKIEAIAAALDEARAEGAERERWECYQAIKTPHPWERAWSLYHAARAAIEARGPMRGPEEE